MSPIKNISDIRRLPRLGKIRLGIKEISNRTGNPYPKPTDYFVVPDEIKGIVGDKPTTLKIMFPVDDERLFAQQWLRCYSYTQGLVCKGDGILARRKVDLATGDIANHETKEWVYKEVTCNPETCPQYLESQCRRVLNLMFILPSVPGLGVWQLDTSSFWSIVNINSAVDLIKRFCGRISFIPLTLSLEPIDVFPPGAKRKTVHVLGIRSDTTLVEILKAAKRKPEELLLPEVSEDEIPEDLFPPEIAGGDKEIKTVAQLKEPPAPPLPTTAESERVTKPTKEELLKIQPKNLGELFTLALHHFKLNRTQTLKLVGYSSPLDVTDIRQAWYQLVELKTTPLPHPTPPHKE